MKRFLSVMVLVALFINLLSTAVFAGDFDRALYLEYDGAIYKYNSRLVTIVIDGAEVKTGDMPGVILDGRTLVPVKEVFESSAFGAKVEWNAAKQEIYISYGTQFIVLAIDNNTAYVNNVAYTLDVPAKLVRDMKKDYAKTMIPLRFVSEVLKFKVKWDDGSYTANLSTPVPETPVVAQNPTTGTTDVTGGKLDVLTGTGAKRTLPTELSTSPITWSASEELLAGANSGSVSVPLTKENNPETKIYDVDYDGTGLNKKFVIKANSAMSEVSYNLWDNKLIIDITNAINGLPAEETFENNSILSSVRASQYSSSPNKTRIVFDLIEGGNKFDYSFSADRKSLYVTASENTIKQIYLGQNEKGDFIKVTGVTAPDVTAFRLSTPDRIVIDFPNTTSLLGFKESLAQGQYILKMRTAQYDETTTRIVVETDGQADYQVTKANNGETIIQFIEPGYDNIEYKNATNPTISLDQVNADINLKDIVYTNDYRNRTFTITLPKNYSALFGDGSLKVNDGIIETIKVTENNKNLTQIVITSNEIREYRIEKVDQKIVIKAYRPKELYSKIIVVDPGHGGKDPGAVANGLRESDLNLKLTNYLKGYLDADNSIKVYYTRLSDEYPTLQQRTDLANEVQADFFLSIHNNAFNPSETGTETLYFPSKLPDILTSPKLATIFQKNIVAATGFKNRGIKQRENLFVLKHSTMPAIIVEIGFLTNTNDVAKLKSEDFLKTVSKSLYQSIVETFNDYPTKR